jgi:hypothetical protein
MAQTTKNGSTARTKRSTASRNGSRAGSNGTARSTSTRKPSSKASSKRAAPKSNAQAKTQSRTQSRTQSTGEKISAVASQAKTPLIAGGTALIGVATGVLAKDRLSAKRSKNPISRLKGISMPKPALDLQKVDLDKVKSAAERVSAYGQRASDVVSAYEKTRKKNK